MWTLKACRVNAGYTQAQVCKLLHISKPTLIAYEQGRSVPKIDMAKLFADLYKVSIDDINFFRP